ncbi:MAG TPA: DUF4838 domain-containing protein [Tepidisphaeraceae bacterium]|nr:DUF4838 domain-containing protein [Tepidisphaeraceae bacterium]
MHRNARITAGVVILGAVLTARGAGAAVLVDRPAGIAPAPVIVAKDAPPLTREAAQVLADYVAQISGGPRPAVVEGAPDPLPERAIWVGLQPAVKGLFPKVDFEFARPEETLTVAGDRHVVIAGRDRTVGDTTVEAGTNNAVYAFIEKDLGVRWLWPGALGTDVPRRERVEVAATERRFAPPFRYRVLWPRGQAEWHKAQRVMHGSLRFDAGHAFTKWWDAYGDKHPEYFAQRADGTRKPGKSPAMVKLCVSNPAVGAQWLANAEQAFKADPARVMSSAAPNDGDGFCVCAKCRAMDHPEGPKMWGYVALTDRQVKFWNGLARGLAERVPGREAWVGVYAYSAYKTPPVAEKLEANVAVGYVGHFPMVSEEGRRADKAQWLAWAGQARAMVYRPNLFHYSGGFLGLPNVPLRRTIEDFRFLAENKCVGIEVDTLPMCWATQGVQFYLMAQLAYDPLQDGEAVLRDYYTRAFGPAAQDVARYFAALEEAHYQVLERVKLSSGWARQATEVFTDVYTDAVWAGAGAHLTAAEAKVGGAGAEVFKERVAFVRTGWEGAKLQVEVLRAMAAVRAGGGAEAIRKADEVCAARDAVLARYNGSAIKRAKWYVESRGLADYVDGPSEAMRKGEYKGPAKGKSTRGED